MKSIVSLRASLSVGLLHLLQCLRKGGRAILFQLVQQLHSDTLDAATVDPKDLKQLGTYDRTTPGTRAPGGARGVTAVAPASG